MRRLAVAVRWFLACSTLAIAACSGPSGEPGDVGRAVASRFLDEIRAGRIDVAWQDTSVEFKSLMGLDSLREQARTRPALRAPAEFRESRSIDREGRSMSEYVFLATVPTRGKLKPGPVPIIVLVAPGEGGLRVEHIRVE